MHEKKKNEQNKDEFLVKLETLLGFSGGKFKKIY